MTEPFPERAERVRSGQNRQRLKTVAVPRVSLTAHVPRFWWGSRDGDVVARSVLVEVGAAGRTAGATEAGSDTGWGLCGCRDDGGVVWVPGLLKQKQLRRERAAVLCSLKPGKPLCFSAMFQLTTVSPLGGERGGVSPAARICWFGRVCPWSRSSSPRTLHQVPGAAGPLGSRVCSRRVPSAVLVPSPLCELRASG